MKKTVVLLCLSSLLVIGCASRSQKLQREYDRLAREIEALQKERTALVNLQVAGDKYLGAKREYERRKKELETVREENLSHGYTVGPDLPYESNIEEEIEELKENYSTVTDQIRIIENRKDEVTEEQADLES